MSWQFLLRFAEGREVFVNVLTMSFLSQCFGFDALFNDRAVTLDPAFEVSDGFKFCAVKGNVNDGLFLFTELFGLFSESCDLAHEGVLFPLVFRGVVMGG